MSLGSEKILYYVGHDLTFQEIDDLNQRALDRLVATTVRTQPQPVKYVSTPSGPDDIFSVELFMQTAQGKVAVKHFLDYAESVVWPVEDVYNDTRFEVTFKRAKIPRKERIPHMQRSGFDKRRK